MFILRTNVEVSEKVFMMIQRYIETDPFHCKCRGVYVSR